MTLVSKQPSLPEAHLRRSSQALRAPTHPERHKSAIAQPYAVQSAEPRHAGLHNRVVLARLGPVTLVNFGVLAAVGGALAAWVSLARLEQAGMRPEAYAALLFGAVPLLAVLGSRAFSLALDWRELVAVAAYARVDLFMLMDAMALGFPLGHAIGRVGCHTYGCCHGHPTRSRLAIRYTHPDSKAVWHSHVRGIPLHPAQFYSALGNVLLFVILALLASGEVRAGQIGAAYLLVGSVGRFFVEFVRGEPTTRFLRLTPFQWVAIGLFGCGLGLLHAAAANPLHERFADSGALVAGLRQAGLSAYPLWVFVVIFVAFAIQGRQVGSFGTRAAAPRVPH